jgi:hypothetical protein
MTKVEQTAKLTQINQIYNKQPLQIFIEAEVTQPKDMKPKKEIKKTIEQNKKV